MSVSEPSRYQRSHQTIRGRKGLAEGSEPGGAAWVAVATVSYVELHAALARKLREGTRTHAVHTLVCRRFEDDWHAYLRLDLTDEVLTHARHLVQFHPLRGLDAIHVASALVLKDALGEQITFVGADQRQLQAAASKGLETLDPEASDKP